MLPIDIVKSGKARNESFDKAEVSMEGFFQVLAGGYPQKSGIKTFEIQYNDGHLGGAETYKQNGLPASLFVEINWNDNTIRTFFATQPTLGDGFYQGHRTPFYTFDSDVLYGHNGIEHYDYPARKLPMEESGAFGPSLGVENNTRSHTHEPRHNKDGAFSDWLFQSQYQNSILSGSKVYHIDTLTVSNILNWKQGIGWMDKS